MIRTSLSLFLLLLLLACGDSSEESTQNPTLADLMYMAIDQEPSFSTIGPDITPYKNVSQTVSGPRYSIVLPWFDEEGLGFNLSMFDQESNYFSPTQWRGRLMIRSETPDTVFQETEHAFGEGWRAFEAERLFPGAGKWRVSVTSNVTPAHPVRQPWVNYAPFSRLIEIDEFPELPPGRDWQIFFINVSLAGALDGVRGSFKCATFCYLEFNRNTEAKGYHPGIGAVVFTPDDPSLPEVTLPSATTVAPHEYQPAIDYLVAGSWLYTPEDPASTDYDFGVYAAGGYPYGLPEVPPKGTVTYTGTASGHYFTDRSSDPKTGTFTSDVTTTINFAEGTVSVRAYNFKADVDLPTELEFQSPISEFADPVGAMHAGGAGSIVDGEWKGGGKVAFYGLRFFEDGSYPTSANGTFGSSDGENGLVGYFVTSP